MNLPASVAKMRTHCVGRYLVDLPEALELTTQSDVELYFGLTSDFRTVKMKVIDHSGTAITFNRTIRRRSSELAADFHFNSPSKNMLALDVKSRQFVDSFNEQLRLFSSPFLKCLDWCLLLQGALRDEVVVG